MVGERRQCDSDQPAEKIWQDIDDEHGGKVLSISHAGRADLFEGTEIWEYGEYREQQGTYPVIFLSFAEVKETNFQDARKKIGYIIEQLYSQHDFLLEGDLLNEKEKRFFRNVTAEMEIMFFPHP